MPELPNSWFRHQFPGQFEALVACFVRQLMHLTCLGTCETRPAERLGRQEALQPDAVSASFSMLEEQTPAHGQLGSGGAKNFEKRQTVGQLETMMVQTTSTDSD